MKANPTPVLGRQQLLDALTGWDEQDPITVALLDIDEFMSVNQNHGHEVGDKAIALLLKTLESSLSSGVMLARIGGDEFACAFPAASPEEALIQMEEIRQHLASKKHDFGEASFPIRISVGIASFPRHVGDPSQLLQAADEALLRAKREGRGRVSIYVEDKMVLKSNYYPKAQLARLATLSERLGKTEAALLREALGDCLEKYRDSL
jgi:diguanylate cyclase (GGDEF)-like protein